MTARTMQRWLTRMWIAVCLLAAAAFATRGEWGWAWAGVMSVAWCIDSVVWSRRAMRLVDEVHAAKDDARIARIEQARLQAKLRDMSQSDDHEAAIDGYPVPPPLPPPPAPGER